MEKDPAEEENYTAANHIPANLSVLEYSLDHPLKPRENSEDNIEMVDYMLNHHPPPPHPAISLDKLSFADVMQFADFGPKLALNHSKIPDEENYFLRFPVLSDKLQENPVMMPPPPLPTAVNGEDGFNRMSMESNRMHLEEERDQEGEEDELRSSENASSVQQVHFLGGVQATGGGVGEVKNRRKRPRSLKTTEEVESQRMTHIAVERNRRKQMNEHLRVLRSLMPGSYVQRGDQASIIGGAIEFVRELEQLLQCLESQKRRRIFGGAEAPRPITDAPPPMAIQQTQPPFFSSPPPLPNSDHMNKLLEFDTSGLREETAENKSCLADVEVKLLGFDAMIKILSRRRPGQLLKAIAALEDLQLNILHTNITTIEQTVLYSFNVKIMGETRFTAEQIANSVQQIFNFINASTI